MKKKFKPIITKVMEASTGHITEKDNKLLNSSCIFLEKGKDFSNPILHYKYEEGSFIYVPQFFKRPLKEYGYSKDFINLMRLAHENKCKYLQLDRDALIYPELPQFDW